MGKHSTVICWRCNESTPTSRVSSSFGCRKCRPAAGTPEYLRLESAGWEKRAHEREERKQKQAVLTLVPAPRPSGTPSAASFNTKQAAIGRAVFAEEEERDKIKAMMATYTKEAARPRCSCCSYVQWKTMAPFLETDDGKLFCVLCAYGVLRTGHCSPHNTTFFPDVAAAVQRIPAWEYPVDVLATQGTKPETYLPIPAAFGDSDF